MQILRFFNHLKNTNLITSNFVLFCNLNAFKVSDRRDKRPGQLTIIEGEREIENAKANDHFNIYKQMCVF